MMNDYQKQYADFVDKMLERCQPLGIDLSKYPIDHVCFRVKSSEEYHALLEDFVGLSVVYTTKQFHGRTFHAFLLKVPFSHRGVQSYTLEFSEPGGSDTYETGFQHLELASVQELEDLFTQLRQYPELFFEGKYEQESYLKWQDKLVLKVNLIPMIYRSTAEDNPTITTTGK